MERIDKTGTFNYEPFQLTASTSMNGRILGTMGTKFGDVFNGDDGDTFVNAGAGNDVVVAGNGADIVNAGSEWIISTVVLMLKPVVVLLIAGLGRG